MLKNIIDKIQCHLKAYAVTSALKRLLFSSETSDLETKLAILEINGIDVTLNISEEKEAKSFKFMKSEWANRIATCMVTQPISRIIPGKTLSLKYGTRATKYIRNFTVKQCFDIFKKQFDFDIKLFTQQI